MICVIGDVMLDVLLLPELRREEQAAGIAVRGGGSAANTAHWISNLGEHVEFVGCVGSDPVGRMLIDELEGNGVIPRVRSIDKMPSGAVAVEITDHGERTMRSARGANQELSPSDIRSTDGLSWVHLTGYSLLGRWGLEMIEAAGEIARGADAPLSFDPSSTGVIRRIGAEELRQVLLRSGVSVLLPSAVEAETLIHGARGSSCVLTREEPEEGEGNGHERQKYLKETTAALADIAPTVIVKDGRFGAVYSYGGEARRVKTEPKRPRDTTGAGDAFNAGVIVSLLREWNPEEACQRGHKVAGAVIGIYGGRPTSRAAS